MIIKEIVQKVDEIDRRGFLKGASAAAGLYGLSQLYNKETGCDYYASKYPCDYIIDDALYDVELWIPKFIYKIIDNSYDSDEDVFSIVARNVKGLKNVRDVALNKHSQIVNYLNQLDGRTATAVKSYPWNERLYMGLMKDLKGTGYTGYEEKHRYIEPFSSESHPRLM